jgi:hypothetical protein
MLFRDDDWECSLKCFFCEEKSITKISIFMGEGINKDSIEMDLCKKHSLKLIRSVKRMVKAARKENPIEEDDIYEEYDIEEDIINLSRRKALLDLSERHSKA